MAGAFDLTSRVAVVTGGNGGIGLGMATGLAQAGARVAVVGRNAEKNRAAVASLEALGTEAAAFEADLTQEAACRAAIDAAADRFGRLDILVNNAGTNIRRRPQDYALAEWLAVLEINLTSAFLCAQAAHPHMQRAGGGKVVNIGSMLSIFGGPFHAPYASSKGGIVQLTKALACSWAADGIQVNAVLPGWIDTELTRGARRDMPDLEQRITARTPAGRWGTPEDFAGIAAFLAGPGSDFITGAVITVDGGYSVAI